MRLVLTLFVILVTLPGRAQDSVYAPVVEKRDQKVRERWTLEKWIVMKPKRRQSNWLAWDKRKKPLFELLVDVRGGYPSYDRSGEDPSDKNFGAIGGGLATFLGPVGFGISRDQYKIRQGDQFFERDEGALYLRILGQSTQSTHLTMLGGTRKLKHEVQGSYQQSFYGVQTNLYLFRHFGAEAQYRFLVPAKSDSHAVEGRDHHFGMFWELSILRVYWLYRQEYFKARRRGESGRDDERIHGSVVGLRLHF